MNAKSYYDSARKKFDDMTTCRLCGNGRVSLYIISEEGKPDRVNPVCQSCHSEHIYDQDRNLQRVITHVGAVNLVNAEQVTP